MRIQRIETVELEARRSDSFAVELMTRAYQVGRRAASYSARGEATLARELARQAAGAARLALELTGEAP